MKYNMVYLMIRDIAVLTLIATNHLGPFLLTNLMLNHNVLSENARIVNVSSESHRAGTVDMKDLEGRRYGSMLF